MHAPRNVDFQMVKRIFRYVCGTTLDLDFNILSCSSLDLYAFAYTDWAGCRLSDGLLLATVSFLVLIACMSWTAKKQTTVARSTAKVEYHALAYTATAPGLTWISFILRDIWFSQPRASLLFSDNISALHLTTNPIFHAYIKHIEIDYHFV